MTFRKLTKKEKNNKGVLKIFYELNSFRPDEESQVETRGIRTKESQTRSDAGSCNFLPGLSH